MGGFLVFMISMGGSRCVNMAAMATRAACPPCWIPWKTPFWACTAGLAYCNWLTGFNKKRWWRSSVLDREIFGCVWKWLVPLNPMVNKKWWFRWIGFEDLWETHGKIGKMKEHLLHREIFGNDDGNLVQTSRILWWDMYDMMGKTLRNRQQFHGRTHGFRQKFSSDFSSSQGFMWWVTGCYRQLWFGLMGHFLFEAVETPMVGCWPSSLVYVAWVPG